MLLRQQFPLGRVGLCHLLQDIGAVKFSAGGGALGLSSFVVCSGKDNFDVRPSFMLNRQTSPGFEFVFKKSGLVYKLEGDTEDLF